MKVLLANIRAPVIPVARKSWFGTAIEIWTPMDPNGSTSLNIFPVENHEEEKEGVMIFG